MSAGAGNKESERSPQKTCIGKITTHETCPPVNADGDEVEDGGGGADDVHGQVEVANPHRQAPLAPVYLAMETAAKTASIFNSPNRSSLRFIFSLSMTSSMQLTGQRMQLYIKT